MTNDPRRDLDQQLELVRSTITSLVEAFGRFHDHWPKDGVEPMDLVPLLQKFEDAVAEIETTANNLRNELAHTLGMCCLIPREEDSQMRAAQEMLHTLFNELVNSSWTFDNQEVREFNIDEMMGTIKCHLASGRMLEIRVTERESPKDGICQCCGELKGDWPDKWRNIGGKGLVYACADCVAKQEKKDG